MILGAGSTERVVFPSSSGLEPVRCPTGRGSIKRETVGVAPVEWPLWGCSMSGAVTPPRSPGPPGAPRTALCTASLLIAATHRLAVPSAPGLLRRSCLTACPLPIRALASGHRAGRGPPRPCAEVLPRCGFQVIWDLGGLAQLDSGHDPAERALPFPGATGCVVARVGVRSVCHHRPWHIRASEASVNGPVSYSAG